jgi:hypothetical protein
MESPWTEEAKAIAAQVWCQPTTESIQFDPRLATEFAKTLAIWMETAAVPTHHGRQTAQTTHL